MRPALSGTVNAVMPSSTTGELAARGTSASEGVLHGILGALEARRIVPGQRLVEVELAAAFAVSRNSVREALQRLAAEGLVELVRNKGAVIRHLSLQETLDVLEVAERISGLLARGAARAVHRGAPAKALSQAIKQLARAAAGEDDPGFALARRAYYRALLDLSANRELRRLVPVIQMPIVHAQNPLPGLRRMRVDDYKAVARAVLAGDEDAADLAAMAHVDRVREAILNRVE